MPAWIFEAVPGEDFKVLPEGVHPCEDAEFLAVFVTAFSKSRTRLRIWNGFFRMRSRFRALGIHALHWIDGSYVTSKVNPNDIDAVGFVSAQKLNLLSPAGKEFLEELGDSMRSKRAYQTHHFIVPVYEKEDARYGTYEMMRAYWRKWWGQTRRGGRKGFVSMVIGSQDQIPQVRTD